VYLSWFAKPPPKIAVLRNPRIGQFANSCGWLSTSRGITRCRAGGAEHLTLLKLVGVEEVAGPCGGEDEPHLPDGQDLEDLGVLASRAGRRGVRAAAVADTNIQCPPWPPSGARRWS